jgi:hypothetical protein
VAVHVAMAGCVLSEGEGEGDWVCVSVCVGAALLVTCPAAWQREEEQQGSSGPRQWSRAGWRWLADWRTSC